MPEITAAALRHLLEQSRIALSDAELERLVPVYRVWRGALDRRLWGSGIEETEEVAAVYPSRETWPL